MPGKHQIKPLWKTHIDSFPPDTPMLQILSSCMQSFRDEQLSFSEWAAVIKECLSAPKGQQMAFVFSPVHKEETAKKASSQRDDFEDKIITCLSRNPGTKASELSVQLKRDKSTINSILYKLKRENICSRDSEYRWSVIPKTELKVSSSSINNQDQLLDKYEDFFRNLTVSKRGDKRAPHKYVLLISIANLIYNGKITSNRINSSLDLEKEFHWVWEHYVPIDTEYKCAHTYPFWHMMSEPFWRLHLKDGSEITSQWESAITTVNRQRKELYAEIDEDLYSLLNIEYPRRYLTHVLIDMIKSFC